MSKSLSRCLERARGPRLAPAGAALAVAAALFLPTGAHALFGDDEARRAILDLRQRFEQAGEAQKAEQARTAEQFDQLRRSVLELNTQLELMRGEIARLRGRNEELAREIAELQRRQTDLAQGLDERIRQVEPQRTVVDGKEIVVRPDERRDYEAALDIFRKGDFQNAAAAFMSFQRRYPGSGYTESVLYWLGNAHYGRRDYKEALATFRQLVTSRAGSSARTRSVVVHCDVPDRTEGSSRRSPHAGRPDQELPPVRSCARSARTPGRPEAMSPFCRA
ncbi:MAG: hypothetical protein KatS3mg122_3104 [Caldimonas sp.]|nr:MAG: hypothetical protein KatS3mg122_3104 [Caldimonas sp.]